MPRLSKNDGKWDKILLLLKQNMPDKQRKTQKSQAVVDFEKIKYQSIYAFLTIKKLNYKKNIDSREKLIQKLKLMVESLFELQDALNAEKERLISHYINNFKKAENELLHPLFTIFLKDTSSNDFMVVDQFIQQTSSVLSQLVDRIDPNQSFKEIHDVIAEHYDHIKLLLPQISHLNMCEDPNFLLYLNEFKEILEEIFLYIIEDFADLAECVRVKNALINLCVSHEIFNEIRTHH